MRRVAPLVLLLLLAPACDGDSEPPPTTTSSTTTTTVPVPCPPISGGGFTDQSLEPLGGPFRLSGIEVKPNLPGCLEQVVFTFTAPEGVQADDAALGFEIGFGERDELLVTVPNGRGKEPEEVEAEGTSLVTGVRRLGRGQWAIDLTDHHSFKVLVRGASDELDLVVSIVD